MEGSWCKYISVKALHPRTVSAPNTSRPPTFQAFQFATTRNMDAPQSQEKDSHSYSAPPTQQGQSQPWTSWFNPDSLDTLHHGEGDKRPQVCKKWTQAVTNIG